MEGRACGSTFHQLERGEGFLDILLEMLKEDGCLSLQQEIEPAFRSFDF